MRPLAGLEEPGLQVQAQVADALAVELVLVVAHVGAAVAVHDRERQRRADLELDRAELEAVGGDQRGLDDVVDRVRVGVAVGAVELEQVVRPLQRADAERQLVVAQHLRGVDRQVAARVHRRMERVEVDVARRLGGGGRGERAERGGKRQRAREQRGNGDGAGGAGSANGHVASGVRGRMPRALLVVDQSGSRGQTTGATSVFANGPRPRADSHQSLVQAAAGAVTRAGAKHHYCGWIPRSVCSCWHFCWIAAWNVVGTLLKYSLAAAASCAAHA